MRARGHRVRNYAVESRGAAKIHNEIAAHPTMSAIGANSKRHSDTSCTTKYASVRERSGGYENRPPRRLRAFTPVRDTQRAERKCAHRTAEDPRRQVIRRATCG